MGLADVLRNGIAIASTVTADLQANVTWEAWTGQDFEGTPTFADPVTLRAVVDLTRKRRYDVHGQLIAVVATLTFLDPVTPNGAADRREPIDPRDRITLPDGQTGPILEAPGAVWDPAMDRPFLNEVMIGEPNSNG